MTRKSFCLCSSKFYMKTLIKSKRSHIFSTISPTIRSQERTKNWRKTIGTASRAESSRCWLICFMASLSPRFSARDVVTRRSLLSPSTFWPCLCRQWKMSTWASNTFHMHMMRSANQSNSQCRWANIWPFTNWRRSFKSISSKTISKTTRNEPKNGFIHFSPSFKAVISIQRASHWTSLAMEDLWNQWSMMIHRCWLTRESHIRELDSQMEIQWNNLYWSRSSSNSLEETICCSIRFSSLGFRSCMCSKGQWRSVNWE